MFSFLLDGSSGIPLTQMMMVLSFSGHQVVVWVTLGASGGSAAN
jgi:hypothetical protein